MYINKTELHKKICNTLLESGMSQADASITSEILISGTERGYVNHGVDRLSQILDGIKNKTINPKAEPKTVSDKAAISVIDAKYAVGQPIAVSAMNLAIKKAKEFGIGAVGVINSGHIGMLAYYSELASKNNCIGIAMTTSSPASIIAGGKIKTFGTNPISYSIPHKPYPITADFSTTRVSRAKIYEHLHNKEPIPLGWAVDEYGHDTTKAESALKGGLHSLDSGFKGNLITMLISVLAGQLLGGVSNHKVSGTRYMDKKPNKGDLFIALDIAGFTNQDQFDNEINELVDFISQQNAEFRIPGIESQKRKSASGKNIIIPDHIKKILF